MSADSGEKTFEATEQRREEFRKQGRYARAKDASGIAATAAVVLGLMASRRQMSSAFDVLFSRTIGDLGALDRLGAMSALRAATVPIFAEIFPVLIGAAVLAMLIGAAQVGFRINTEAISPKFERLDPKGGLDKLFSLKKNFAELALSLARVGAVGTVAYNAISRELPVLVSVAQAPLQGSTEVALGAISRVIFSVLVSLFVIAAADYAYSWFSLEQEMKMTRQERIEESKREDGDPKLKAKMKARARQLLKKASIEGVKTADVIVTNPTHVAVALRYGPKDAAPIVVAKGTDEVALRIRTKARALGIPILENRPLARALNAEVTVGRPIPQAHFAAVAQVLAFVYRLKKRGAIGGTRRA